MPRLSESQRRGLDEIWGKLGASSASVSPPMTDEEVDAAVLDSWIAGVLSSRGECSEAAVQDLLDFEGKTDLGSEVGKFVERVVKLVSPSG